MKKIILFSENDLAGSVQEIILDETDLVTTGRDIEFRSAIVVNRNWRLFDEVNFTSSANVITLSLNGGRDADGVYYSPKDWGSGSPFHVKSARSD